MKEQLLFITFDCNRSIESQEMVLEKLDKCTVCYDIGLRDCASVVDSTPSLFELVRERPCVAFQLLHEQDSFMHHCTAAYFEDGTCVFEYSSASWDRDGTYIWNNKGKVNGTYVYEEGPDGAFFHWHTTRFVEEGDDGRTFFDLTTSGASGGPRDSRFRVQYLPDRRLARTPLVSYGSFCPGDSLFASSLHEVPRQFPAYMQHSTYMSGATECVVPNRGKLFTAQQ